MSKADEVKLNNARSIFCVQYTCTPNRLVEIENRYACVIIHGKHYLFNSIKFCTSCALFDLQCGTSPCPVQLLASSTNFAAGNVVLYFCVGICYGITVACLLIGLVKITNLLFGYHCHMQNILSKQCVKDIDKESSAWYPFWAWIQVLTDLTLVCSYDPGLESELYGSLRFPN